ncbi:Snf12p [Sugiyamaella lignohabitans]|uniref:Snf12p n=1 Tax=Sugiyamaella lignohabitans TaxID=796027 RepID=A0A167D283_9ASCO|nr:Snf12p [Sugiyamaella lignohabitans]ANB12390.1 Snf12p [Sugiyamaella lignohabitans]
MSYRGKQQPGRGGPPPPGMGIPPQQVAVPPPGGFNAGVPVPPGPAVDQHYLRKPTDLNLPDKIENVIPEAKLYTDLQDAERRLDATISRKKMDLQDTIARSIMKTKTLRVFISSSVSDQPWQTVPQLNENSFDFMDSQNTPLWNLRIEGRLVDDVSYSTHAREVRHDMIFTVSSLSFFYLGF